MNDRKANAAASRLLDGHHIPKRFLILAGPEVNGVPWPRFLCATCLQPSLIGYGLHVSDLSRDEARELLARLDGSPWVAGTQWVGRAAA